MSHWMFHSAGSLAFGRGVVDRLDESARPFGANRAFVVTDAALVNTGLAERVAGPLAAAGWAVEVYAGGVPEPPDAAIRAAAEAARAFRPEVVIGLGGGSNLDTAKLVAVLLTHGGEPAEYAGEFRVPGPVLPIVAVPTTAGTGSEVTPAAVFTDTARGLKVSCLSPHVRPMLAVVDPALTDGCPRRVTADAGLDALVHAVEAFTAADNDEFQRRPGGRSIYQGKNPMADLAAAECVRLCGRFLRRAVDNPTDRQARDGMALAATLGGLAFANAGVALVHAMEYPVGAAVHVSHGAGNGLLLPHVMRYNAAVRGEELRALAGLLGADDAIAAVERLRDDIGIPRRLRDLGVTREMLPGFAAKAFTIRRLLRVNPRMPASEAEILTIYEAAF